MALVSGSVYSQLFAAEFWDHFRLVLQAAPSLFFFLPPYRGCWIQTLTLFIYLFFLSPRHGAVTLIVSMQKLPQTSARLISKFSFRQAVPSIYSFILCDVIQCCLVELLRSLGMAQNGVVFHLLQTPESVFYLKNLEGNAYSLHFPSCVGLHHWSVPINTQRVYQCICA